MDNQISKSMCQALRKMSEERHDMSLFILNNSEELAESEVPTAEEIYEGHREGICEGDKESCDIFIFYMMGSQKELINQMIIGVINDDHLDWVDIFTEDFHGNQKPY